MYMSCGGVDDGVTAKQEGVSTLAHEKLTGYF